MVTLAVVALRLEIEVAWPVVTISSSRKMSSARSMLRVVSVAETATVFRTNPMARTVSWNGPAGADTVNFPSELVRAPKPPTTTTEASATGRLLWAATTVPVNCRCCAASGAVAKSKAITPLPATRLNIDKLLTTREKILPAIKRQYVVLVGR